MRQTRVKLTLDIKQCGAVIVYELIKHRNMFKTLHENTKIIINKP